MDLDRELWKLLGETPGITEAMKAGLHIKIMRLVEQSRTTVGKKLGVTVMTESASLGGENGNPPVKPKSI